MMPANGTAGVEPDALREQAVKRLSKRRDLYRHLLVYVMVNGLFVAVWAMSGHHGFFWPVFLIAAWGIGVVFNAWDVYRGDELTEQQIRREMQRLHGTR
jgi:hypothetical protein